MWHSDLREVGLDGDRQGGKEAAAVTTFSVEILKINFESYSYIHSKIFIGQLIGNTEWRRHRPCPPRRETKGWGRKVTMHLLIVWGRWAGKMNSAYSVMTHTWRRIRSTPPGTDTTQWLWINVKIQKCTERIGRLPTKFGKVLPLRREEKVGEWSWGGN